MGNVNKNNSRHIISGTKGLQIVYVIRPHVYVYSPINSPNGRANIGKFIETHTNWRNFVCRNDVDNSKIKNHYF
jgi:hypothetical protein